MALNESGRFMDSFITHLSENNKSVPLWSISKALLGPMTIKQDLPALSIGLCLFFQSGLSNGLQQVGGQSSVDSQVQYVLESLIMKDCSNPLRVWRVKPGAKLDYGCFVAFHGMCPRFFFSCCEEQSLDLMPNFQFVYYGFLLERGYRGRHGNLVCTQTKPKSECWDDFTNIIRSFI